ncbi:unnamed protein product [Macrosiphum euphorbiae]|uniref:Uncharacterized protein n=1 Tax=Macrosiphum euphorbiae TaxID=13131 RepID=A0AAV0VYD5_9HEMI|nr:unnamed protein product [Macrosiphum euphorbiae]
MCHYCLYRNRSHRVADRRWSVDEVGSCVKAADGNPTSDASPAEDVCTAMFGIELQYHLQQDAGPPKSP